VISQPNTVTYPGAMVIHTNAATVTIAAMMRPGWFGAVADLAKS